MQAKAILAYTAMTQNSQGLGDIIRYRFQPYVNTAGAVTAANNFLAALTAWRNNIHAELADGIVEVAPTIVANGTSDDGNKLRYIARECITSVEANAFFGISLPVDQTKVWLNITGAKEPQFEAPTLYGELVDGNTPLYANNAARTTDFNLRAAVVATAYALWDAVDSL